MNVIILAAGEGKRLRPLTNDRPKCLIEFHGKTLLDRQVSVFQRCGIDNICVVTGYNDHMFKNSDLEYVYNENFLSTNMLKSLFCAEKKITESTIVSYGDIIFEEKVLRNLIDAEDDFSVIIDKNWEEYWKLRFDNPIDDAESLILDHDCITNIGQKVDDISKINGQYIGLMKFQNDGIKKMKDFFIKCKQDYKENNINPLNSKRSFDDSYMTDFLQGLIKQGKKLKAIFIENGWLEFDNIQDYNLYTNNNSETNIRKFYDIND